MSNVRVSFSSAMAQQPISALAPVAIFYEDDGYVEQPTARPGRARPPQSQGPLGRRVAGKEFLLAYLRHARTDPIYALVRDRKQAQSVQVFRTHPSLSDLTNQRKIGILLGSDFHRTFFPKSPVAVLHYPSPIDPRFAWARQYGGPTFALSGITHTISTAPAMNVLTGMITMPLESFDALICISRAAVQSVRAVTDNYCEYLKSRYGGNPVLRPRLANIPLGVDVAKYRPPTPEERAQQRQKLGIADDEIVVLYLGRLIYHGKVHPFPIYQGLVGAAKATNKKVRLIMAGWSPDERILNTFKAGAQTFAAGITTTFVDARSDEVRYSVWWAADIFAFPTDNVQETFPQSVIEAMACGLPVVAADWDGCRDQVIHGKTGFLIPTYSVPGATADTTSRLIVRELRYDEFLARCNQAVAVDVEQTAQAMMQLMSSPQLRARMGEAGRARAVTEFSWERIIGLYESLWAEQEQERQAFVKNMVSSAPKPSPFIAPVSFPPPEFSFQSYPSKIVDPKLHLRAAPDAANRIDACLRHPMTGYAGKWRSADREILGKVLQSAASAGGISIMDIDAIFAQAGVDPIAGHATIAWMMKYAVLEVVEPSAGS